MTQISLNRFSFENYTYGYTTSGSIIQFGDEFGSADPGYIEQCVLEFDIDPSLIDTSSAVTLEFTLNSSYVGDKNVRRWKNAYPANSTQLGDETALNDATNEVVFTTQSGTVSIDIRNMVADMATNSQPKVVIGFPETAANEDYAAEIDNGAGNEPTLTYTPTGGTPITVDDIDSQAEMSDANVPGPFASGSFETGLDGWTNGADWTRAEDQAHDGTWSMKGDLHQSGASGQHKLTRTFDTTGIPYANLSFWAYIEGPASTFPSTGGFDVYVNNVLKGSWDVWWNGSDMTPNQWNEVNIELTEGVNAVEIRLSQHPDLATSYFVHFDDFEVARDPIALTVNSSQTNPQVQQVPLGIAGIDLTVDDSDTNTELQPFQINIMAEAEDFQSQSEMQAPTLGGLVRLGVYSMESSTEIETKTLTGHASLEVDDVDVKTELRKFGLNTPEDIESQSEISSPTLGVNAALTINGIDVPSEMEPPTLAGKASLAVDSFETEPQLEQVNFRVVFSLDVDSFDSKSEMSRSNITRVIVVDPADVGSCTPTGSSEELITATAGEAITKGDLITIGLDDVAYKSTASDYDLSLYTGFALTNADEGEPVVCIAAGDVILGSVLKPNQLYVVSIRSGSIKHISEIAPGDYISIVGIAISATTLRLGTNFQSLLLTTASVTPATGSTVAVDPDSVKILPGDREPYVTSGEVDEEVEIGDSINRNMDPAEAANATNSSFLGIAISKAASGCTAGVCTRGDVKLGDGVLLSNMVYAVARVRGDLMPVTDWQESDYATIAGIAVSDDALRLGAIEKGTLAV